MYVARFICPPSRVIDLWLPQEMHNIMVRIIYPFKIEMSQRGNTGQASTSRMSTYSTSILDLDP